MIASSSPDTSPSDAADRYGFDLIGAVVPGLTSQGEPNAGDLSELAGAIESAGVPTIFTEIGTPAAVVEAIADETRRDSRRTGNAHSSRRRDVPYVHARHRPRRR